jgi:hypothetical protein
MKSPVGPNFADHPAGGVDFAGGRDDNGMEARADLRFDSYRLRWRTV